MTMNSGVMNESFDEAATDSGNPNLTGNPAKVIY
jgi:hypothetical protein